MPATALQPLILQPVDIEAQSTSNQETPSSISSDRYEAVAITNAANIYPFAEDAGTGKNEMTMDDPMHPNLSYNVSETCAATIGQHNKANVLLATSSNIETFETGVLQSSVDAILAADSTTEIHPQYELATIEEQPELGYQSDSSDTDSLLISSSSRKKIVSCNNGGASQVLRRKASTENTTDIETEGILSSENSNKILAPVIEDSLEENDIWGLPHLK